jgi:hypothetical protein
MESESVIATSTHQRRLASVINASAIGVRRRALEPLPRGRPRWSRDRAEREPAVATGLIAYRRARLAHAIATAIAVFWLDGSFDDVQRDVSMQGSPAGDDDRQTATSLDRTAGLAALLIGVWVRRAAAPTEV